MARILDFIPSPSTLLTVALSSLLGGAVAVSISCSLGPGPTPDEGHMREMGRQYAKRLVVVYAMAWREVATGLERGMALNQSIYRVGREWDAGRTALFDHMLSPEFARIVPEDTKDASLSAADRAALARAWRALADGPDD